MPSTPAFAAAQAVADLDAAAHARGHRAFADDLEQRDVAQRIDMGAAAQLDRISGRGMRITKVAHAQHDVFLAAVALPETVDDELAVAPDGRLRPAREIPQIALGWRGDVAERGPQEAAPFAEIEAAAADAAKRAVLNPRCQPWPLPADKYSSGWRYITFNFDPRDY